jgi:hypothetical protein
VTVASSNSWNATLAANTEAHNGWASIFYEYILIENMTAGVVWVATDGTTATVAGANLGAIPANSSLLVSNRQPKLSKVTTAAGSTDQALINPASGSPTYVSAITSGSGQIVVSPQ